MPPFLATIRFQLFQAIEWIACRLQKTPAVTPRHHFPDLQKPPHPNSRYLWIFASTIGELHAIEPLITALLAGGDSDRLVILTDHPHYIDAFLRAFPRAVIVDHGIDGRISDEFTCYPPSLFVLAEIPLLLADAPCRFLYRVIHELRKRRIAIAAVNGWLYGEQPRCRMDAIEKILLGQSYLRAIDLYTVQNSEVKELLIAAGVNPKKVAVTGNIKFDALFQDEAQLVTPESLRPMVDAIKDTGRPCIVAGCVTNISEQEHLLDAFTRARESNPEALMVLAPRHPENAERMAVLSQLLTNRGLSYILRSSFKGGALGNTSVVLLDTIGELRHLYAVSDVSYVGLNHNVLEPLALDARVLVSHGWERTYPSYPVYLQTKRHGLITETSSVAELADTIVRCLCPLPDENAESVREQLASLCGATRKNIESIRQLRML